MDPDNKIKANENKNTFIYAFKQQIMKAWQPVPTIYSTVILFCLLGLFFLGFGIALIILTQQIVEVTEYYDDKCKINDVCNISIDIPNDMQAPVFFYYQLENFYQNHRRYVKSRDVDQLRGVIQTVSTLDSTCTPVVTMAQLGIPNNKVLNGSSLLDSDPANPCGLIAKSFFNDTYKMSDSNMTSIFIDETGIAWPSDKENKFFRPQNYMAIQWHDVTDGNFLLFLFSYLSLFLMSMKKGLLGGGGGYDNKFFK